MLIISSQNSIDMQAALTFGLSDKITDSAIGMFGTGLKYAIAVTLREGGNFRITCGDQKYVFSSQGFKRRNPSKVSETDYIVTMNDQPVHFTLNYGRNWEAWQVYRELVANAIDEGEYDVTCYPDEIGLCNTDWDEFISTRPDWTHIIIENFPAIDEAHANRSKIFLPTNLVPELTITNSFKTALFAEFFPGPSKYIYYKGMRVATLEGGDFSHYTINMHSGVSLTEDRTVDNIIYTLDNLCRAIVSGDDVKTIKTLLQCNRKSVEGSIDYSRVGTYSVSKEFMQAVKELKDNTIKFSPTAATLAMRALFENSDFKDALEALATAEQHEKVNRAVRFLRSSCNNFPDHHVTMINDIEAQKPLKVSVNSKGIQVPLSCIDLSPIDLAAKILAAASVYYSSIVCRDEYTSKEWLVDLVFSGQGEFTPKVQPTEQV